MKRFTKILTGLVLIVLLHSYSGYSQTRALTVNGDTVVFFTVLQAKKILKIDAKIKELREYLEVTKQQKKYSDSAITSLKEAIKINESVIELQRENIKALTSTIDDKDMIILKQKRFIRIISVTGAVLVIALLL